MTTKQFRDNGAIGALLDEYEKALNELRDLLSTISTEELTTIVDHKTESPSCKSIQTVLSHIVKAGNWYNIEIRNSLGEQLDPPKKKHDPTINDFQNKLVELLESTEQIFTDYPSVDIYKKRELRWKHILNIDILLEHAIVHILRHRRQIERFLLKLRS